MKLLVDAGNTFVKWVWDFDSKGIDWINGASVGRFDSKSLFEADGPQNLRHAVGLSLSEALKVRAKSSAQTDVFDSAMPGQTNVQVWVSSVLGAEGAELLALAFSGGGWQTRFVRPVFPGFESDYLDTETLGRDRWVASLAVAAQSLYKLNLVVSLGTATTIDCVRIERFNAEGLMARHLGGVILPGFGLMGKSLAVATRQLPEATALQASMPCTTEEAIGLGILQAQTGAVRQMAELLQKDRPDEPLQVWVTGGASDLLMQGLDCVVSVRPSLVLEGVWLASAVQEDAV